jgi:hypothetical protein
VRTICAVLAALALLAAAATTAEARSSYCSPTGDLCYGVRDTGAKVKLRITLIAHFFDRFRLCVTAPGGGKVDCRSFRVHRIKKGLYESTVRWAAHFPARGPGNYRARWEQGGFALGPAVSFAAGPSIDVRPGKVHAGRVVRVSGLAGGCPKGDEVTLLSPAFPATHEFAGVPAVPATVGAHDSYSVKVRIPSGRAPGDYTIGARCGGGNFGVSRKLTVLAP